MSDERQDPERDPQRAAGRDEDPPDTAGGGPPDVGASENGDAHVEASEDGAADVEASEADASASRERVGEAEGSARPGPPGPRPKGGRRGRATRPLDPTRPCMNCGDPTPGEYCPSCGQRKVVVQVSVRTLIMDVLEDQFILDRRLPRTLGALLFKPGFLTVEHVNGRIVRYIHPFRLYLVTSLLFFLLLSFLSLRLVREAMDDDALPAVADTTDTAAIDSALAAIETALADTSGDGESAGRAQLSRVRTTLIRQKRHARIDSLEAELGRMDSALTRLDDGLADTALPGLLRATLERTRTDVERRRTVASTQRDSLRADTVALTAAGPGEERTTVAESFGWDESPPTTSIGIGVVDSVVSGQLRRLGAMEPGEAVETFTGTFFNYVPTMMFILLPAFAGVLKLLYIRRRRYYAEHFVFLLHAHSFVFLLATVMLLFRRWVTGWLEVALGLWILVYIFLAMKRVYGQGWLKTFVKYWTLGWMYFWILLLGIPIAFLATLLLF